MTATLFQPATWASRMCPHVPPCPPADAVDHDAARVVADHHEQGWIRLCNGVICFDDGGELIPDNSPRGCHIDPEHDPNCKEC